MRFDPADRTPHLVSKLQMFGQFVGSWDVEITSYKPDGSRQVVDGAWHFGWVLEGRAIQDVLDLPPDVAW